MRIFSYNPITYRPWFWETIDRGIGGSETNAREWAWRLAQRGHEVTVYAPVPWEQGAREWRGTKWQPLEEADFTQEGLWLLYRCPKALDQFPLVHPNQQLWFVAQDADYDWTPEQVAKMDRIIALCKRHRQHLLRDQPPEVADKVCIGSNGLRMDLIREVEAEGIPERNPHKLMFPSSPDRGLKSLLAIFRRAREWVPDLELHIMYGFDNINTLEKTNPAAFKQLKPKRDEILEAAKQPGVFWRGMMPQKELYREWLTTGIWAYPMVFPESSCITSMEAQALGAIPITNPIWALAENVDHGIFIQGDAYDDGLTQARYAAEIVALASDTELQDKIRVDMMRDARVRFNWECTVDDLEAWMYRFDKAGLPEGQKRDYRTQYCFQLKHAKGKILNLGCERDLPGFRFLNGTNLDLGKSHPTLNYDYPVDVVSDARNPLPFDPATFDSVVVGEVLEHLERSDAVQVMRNAAAVTKPGGRVIVTCPDDHRDREAQNAYHVADTEWYVPPVNGTAGVRGYHRPFPVEELVGVIEAAGLEVKVTQPMDYTWFLGWGIVAERPNSDAMMVRT